MLFWWELLSGWSKVKSFVDVSILSQHPGPPQMVGLCWLPLGLRSPFQVLKRVLALLVVVHQICLLGVCCSLAEVPICDTHNSLTHSFLICMASFRAQFNDCYVLQKAEHSTTRRHAGGFTALACMVQHVRCKSCGCFVRLDHGLRGGFWRSEFILQNSLM